MYFSMGDCAYIIRKNPENIRRQGLVGLGKVVIADINLKITSNSYSAW